MRREDIKIGASEAGAVLGVDPFRSPTQVYLRKLGLDEDDGDSHAAFVGRHVEHAIATMFEEEHDVALARMDSVYGDAPFDFARATVDRVLSYDAMPPAFRQRWDVEPGEWLVVEMKTAGLVTGRPSSMLDAEWGAPGSDAVPPKYAVQAQIQAHLLSGWLESVGAGFVRRTLVTALLGGRGVETFVVHRKDDVTAGIMDGLRRFVDEHLVPEVPPTPTAAKDWKAWIDARRVRMASKTIHPATAEDEALAVAYRQAKEAAKALDAEESRLKAALIERIGAAYGIEGGFGRVVYTAHREAPKLARAAFADDVLEIVQRESQSEDRGRRNLALAILALAKERTRAVVTGRQLRATFTDNGAAGATNKESSDG